MQNYYAINGHKMILRLGYEYSYLILLKSRFSISTVHVFHCQ